MKISDLPKNESIETNQAYLVPLFPVEVSFLITLLHANKEVFEAHKDEIPFDVLNLVSTLNRYSYVDMTPLFTKKNGKE